MSKHEERTVCHTPTPGKQPTSIPTWKYTLLEKVILDIVPAERPGVKAKDLPDLVAERLSTEDKAALGSIAWHTTTVKLNMEVEGQLSRVPGARPQHLYRSD